jgi:hypothetical protein
MVAATRQLLAISSWFLAGDLADAFGAPQIGNECKSDFAKGQWLRAKG